MKFTKLVALIVCFGTCGSLYAQPAPTLRSAALVEDSNAGLGQIVDNPLSWRVLAERTRKPSEVSVQTVRGEPTLINVNQYGTILVGQTNYTRDIEIVARVGFKPDANKYALCQFVMGLPAPDDFATKTPTASVDTYGSPTRFRCHLYDGVARKPAGLFYYDLGGLPIKSFGWPDEIRRHVEHNNGLITPRDQQWYTFRCVVREHQIDVWFDGRHIGRATSTDKSFHGYLRFHFRDGVQLASLNVRELDDDPRFTPVHLDHYVNASTINGQTVDRKFLPTPGDRVAIDEVPFIFPQPDEHGNDHIDLEPSWFMEANMEMTYPSNRGAMGGRWFGARRPLANRIQLRVANARFNRIHFIAAADDDADSVPTLSAILYVPLTGVEKVYKATVKPFSKEEAGAMRVYDSKGWFPKRAHLYRVTLEIDPGDLLGFDDKDGIEIELTKDARMYRTYPDPISYSQHQAGPPSSVHIYAMTLEKPAVQLKINPGVFGEHWTAPKKPTYGFELTNLTDQPREVAYSFVTVAHNGDKKIHEEKTVSVSGDGKPVKVNLTLDLSRYGYHDVILTVKDGKDVWTERRSLAFLHPDTRERGNWEDGRGALFGIWTHFGGHDTPQNDVTLPIINAAGIETIGGSFSSKRANEAVRKFAEENGMVTTLLFHAADMYVFNVLMADLKKGMPEEEAVKKAIDKLKENESTPNKIVRTDIVRFFPEPHIGRLVGGVFPDYWGDPEIEYTDHELERMALYARTFRLGAEAIRKEWPDVKLLLPHGDVIFAPQIMRRHPEIHQYVDGVAVDMPNFERLPEMQLHQVCNNRLWLMHQEFKKYGKKPFLELREGPAVPTYPGSVSEDTQADYYPRIFMQMMAYGCQRISCPGEAWDANSYYAAQHYGCGGIHRRKPFFTPKPSYVSYATLTRNINRCNFEKWIETGSHSAYCLQFKHYKNNKLVHAFWNIRGKRNVTLAVPDGATITVYDSNDNPTELKANNGQVSFLIDDSPCYVHGLTADAKVTLGKPNHFDSTPAKLSKKIADLGDGSWRMINDTEPLYENNSPFHHKRFHGNMTAKRTKSGTLAIKIGKQDESRKIMPYYRIIEPSRPIEISGKASHIGIRVKANSDWGRVVYFLRDAKGERWISIGDKANWNCDDIHQWSTFCFDGKRYLRFEMPSHAGYDNYREHGTTWWGAYGGDSVVDLPLKLERIAVERRTHVLYVNDLVPANTADVELGDLYVEYASEFDMSHEVVERSRLRMSSPEGKPDIENPIALLNEAGQLPATQVTQIGEPDHHADGTRCHVHFDTVEGAAEYDVWISPYADGRGALKLGKAWKEPGGMVRGLRPDVSFYAFVAYRDATGKPSKASAGHQFLLKDLFYQK